MIGSQNGSMKSGRDGGPVDRADVVIVGFGIAGMTAAREAHRMAPQASIAIVSAQNHPTIYYPALKQFLMGRLGREQLVAIPPDMERIQQIAVLRATVEQIATREKRVQLDRRAKHQLRQLAARHRSALQRTSGDAARKRFRWRDNGLLPHRLFRPAQETGRSE